ncbi:hypothetical protein ACU8MI_16145 [Rhizobium leguminosarum]
MNGTLAIWYEPASKTALEAPGQSGPKPELEIHFNLWRDAASTTNFLDIGLRISRPELLKRIYLYFPVEIKLGQITDLSEVMKYAQTLDAVFNSVVSVGKQTDLHYTTISDGGPFVTVHKVRPHVDIDLYPIADAPKGTGSQLTFNEEMCKRLVTDDGQDQYVRFRVTLSGRSRTLFTQEITARDRVFVSSAHRLELTELRLNEHRSFPRSIAGNAQKHAFAIKRVHYFLIRELGHALVTQHAPLRKVRRLESHLWASYLRGRPVTEKEAPAEEKLASRMVIYHWREGEKDKTITDFTAFASFQTSAPGLLFYLVAITILGAMGSSLAEMAKKEIGLNPSFVTCALALFVLWLLAWTGVWAKIETTAGSLWKRAVELVTIPFRGA